jgi:hypothetical protein
MEQKNNNRFNKIANWLSIGSNAGGTLAFIYFLFQSIYQNTPVKCLAFLILSILPLSLTCMLILLIKPDAAFFRKYLPSIKNEENGKLKKHFIAILLVSSTILGGGIFYLFRCNCIFCAKCSSTGRTEVVVTKFVEDLPSGQQGNFNLAFKSKLKKELEGIDQGLQVRKVQLSLHNSADSVRLVQVADSICLDSGLIVYGVIYMDHNVEKLNASIWATHQARKENRYRFGDFDRSDGLIFDIDKIEVGLPEVTCLVEFTSGLYFYQFGDSSRAIRYFDHVRENCWTNSGFRLYATFFKAKLDRAIQNPASRNERDRAITYCETIISAYEEIKDPSEFQEMIAKIATQAKTNYAGLSYVQNVPDPLDPGTVHPPKGEMKIYAGIEGMISSSIEKNKPSIPPVNTVVTKDPEIIKEPECKIDKQVSEKDYLRTCNGEYADLVGFFVEDNLVNLHEQKVGIKIPDFHLTKARVMEISSSKYRLVLTISSSDVLDLEVIMYGCGNDSKQVELERIKKNGSANDQSRGFYTIDFFSNLKRIEKIEILFDLKSRDIKGGSVGGISRRDIAGSRKNRTIR